ncbi:MAG: RICIN domain-containing protein, partial [Bacteroidaceae bacterium]|nr:RICIN domain-containing protein [Bacteroidaceae bacterium]
YELESIDDAARVNWGDGWRMPTSDEMEELCNTDNCIWTSTKINEVRVYKVTSKTNGNYIFFPYIEGKIHIDENGRLTCAFWSKDRRSTDGDGETVVMYSEGGTSSYARYNGAQVRAVCTKGKEDVTPLPTYTVSTSATEGGTVTSSASNVEQGGSVTLTATPISGYVFKNWTLGGVVVSTENPYTATITANSEFVANFEEEVSDSGISLTKGYRIKHVESGMYLNVENIDEHTGGTNGGVNCVAYAISNNQIFSFEAVDSNFYLKSKSGYYIYCQDWNVDALRSGTVLTFEENEDGTYYILNGSKYFKVEQVNGTYYPFGDAPANLRATWVLEEAIETPPTTAVYNGHEYIDLGLSVKWATCNVGATTPEGYGDYFAWGETEPKDFYNWNTYKHCVENGDYYSVNSYCPNSDIGVEDNRTILDAEDDAASANWGGTWRMPTKKEQEELLNNCIWEWTSQNGKFGYKIISKINGNSIFLPAAGFFLDGNAQPGNCNYWSSSVKIDSNSSAARLINDSIYYEYRNYGQSVRAVFGED